MRPLKEYKAWKILLGIIIVLAVISAAVFAISSIIDNNRTKENQRDMEAAKAAGYDTEFAICNRVGDVKLDGVDYIRYSRHWTSFVDGQFRKDIMIRKDATYIDDSKGQTQELVIYGKITGYASLPEGVAQDENDKYEVVEPYRFKPYKARIDMWAVAASLALVLFVEGMLITALALYLIIYAIRKAYIKKHNSGDLLSVSYNPGYGDMLGQSHHYMLKKDKDGKWIIESSDREAHSEPMKVTTYSVSEEALKKFEAFIKENNLISLSKRPASKDFVTDYSPWNFGIRLGKEDYSIYQYKMYSKKDNVLIKELRDKFLELKGDVISEKEEE